MNADTVHTVDEYYDVPCKGVATLGGQPVAYEREWDATADDYTEIYWLSPITDDALVLALEAWAIWRRWETAFHQGVATLDSHPALPEERARAAELKLLLEPHLAICREAARCATGEFFPRDDPDWSGRGQVPLAVRWTLQGQ
ncbi:hypothetical protein ABI59_14130 [Acidobacteria bacterium Mor1]|nr:hypothetical protein ABI59_14130 [Acidobacteria bacterium Mor1]